MDSLIRLRLGLQIVLLLAAGGVCAQEEAKNPTGDKEPAAQAAGSGETGSKEAQVEESAPKEEAKPDRNSEPHGMYKWVLVDGTKFEARYRSKVGNNIIMESAKGSQKQIALSRFSPADIEFFELENPPKFRLNFKKRSKILNYSDRFELRFMPVVQLYEFGISAEKRSAGSYEHEVTIEFFALASQLGHNHKFIILNRDSTSFVPSKENDYSLEYWSSRICEVDEYSFNDLESRGKKYEGYLLIVTDKRGKVIDHKTSNKWLYENVEELRNRYIGNYIDETCQRVFPGRPFPDRGGISDNQ